MHTGGVGSGWNVAYLQRCLSAKLTLTLFGFLALLPVSEEVGSRCSLKHRKSLLLTAVSMENVPMDTYPIHHSDTSCRLVV